MSRIYPKATAAVKRNFKTGNQKVREFLEGSPIPKYRLLAIGTVLWLVVLLSLPLDNSTVCGSKPLGQATTPSAPTPGAVQDAGFHIQSRQL